MKVRLRTGSFIPKILGVDGVMLYPFIFIKDKNPTTSLVAHEAIHVRQLREIGFFGFYISYFLYYLAGLFRFKNKGKAYLNIPYEREAFTQQHILFRYEVEDILKDRRY